MLSQGLIIDEPWISHILAGLKTWEMRSRATLKRGPLALIKKRSGQVVGVATLMECRPSLLVSDMPIHFRKHHIPQTLVTKPGYKWFTPWVLTDVQAFRHPVPYNHPAGAVTFVNLETDVLQAIARQGFSTAKLAASTNTKPQMAVHTRETDIIQEKHLNMAQRVLHDIGRGPAGTSVPANAAVKITRKGNKLYIDAEWDDQD